jgi:hypothetical protein
MKPTQAKKPILFLSKKSIAKLTVAEMNQVNGGVGIKPTEDATTTLLETAIGCPCTHFCQGVTV